MSTADHSHDHAHGQDDGELHIHVGSMKLYLGVFAALIFFTFVTVGLSYVHLGSLNLMIAVVIASMKAALVVTFFMHLKDDNRFISLGFVLGLGFIGLFFAYTMNDTSHRGREFDPASGVRVYLGESEKQAPGGFEPAPAEETSEAAAEGH